MIARLSLSSAFALAISLSAAAQPPPPGVPPSPPGAPPAPPAPVVGEGAKFKDLDALLEEVRKGFRTENVEIKRREAEFAAARDQQKGLLQKALAEKQAAEKRGAELERSFEQNELKIAELEETLRIRLGTMGELFGVIRQMAGDARGQVENSIASAQFPGRGQTLAPLAESKALPSVEQLELLWFVLQQEATESGKVVRFRTSVIQSDGSEAEDEVVRVGVFNAVSRGRYLQWLPEVQKLRVLTPQPAGRYVSTVTALEGASGGHTRFAIDPSRGSVLGLLVQTPSLQDTLDAGGLVGYVIMSLAALGLLIGLVRLVQLTIVNRRVRRQEKDRTLRDDNPLGRVLKLLEAHAGADLETRELKLDEALVREQGALERSLWLVNVVAVVAPLLGLLGTITGMIRTFQAIVLFGTGDPKMMASGISEALVTTMQGLLTAIPLVLLYAWLKSVVRRIMDVLNEESTGILAARQEEDGRK